MKKLAEVIEVENEGLVSLLGQIVTIYCLNYIYTGELEGVNDACIKLKNPSLVFNTGDFDGKDWEDAQRFPHKYWYVKTDAIESFGIMK